MKQSSAKPLKDPQLTPEEELSILQKFEKFVANYQTPKASKKKQRQWLPKLQRNETVRTVA